MSESIEQDLGLVRVAAKLRASMRGRSAIWDVSLYLEGPDHRYAGAYVVLAPASVQILRARLREGKRRLGDLGASPVAGTYRHLLSSDPVGISVMAAGDRRWLEITMRSHTGYSHSIRISGAELDAWISRLDATAADGPNLARDLEKLPRPSKVAPASNTAVRAKANPGQLPGSPTGSVAGMGWRARLFGRTSAVGGSESASSSPRGPKGPSSDQPES